LALFYVLEEWIIKYHINNICLLNTSEYFNINYMSKPVQIKPKLVNEGNITSSALAHYTRMPVVNKDGATQSQLFHIKDGVTLPFVFYHHIKPECMHKFNNMTNNNS